MMYYSYDKNNVFAHRINIIPDKEPAIFWRLFVVDQSITHKWLIENIGHKGFTAAHKWYVYTDREEAYIAFRSEEDAVLFKLMWS